MALYLFDLVGTLADASKRYAYAFNRVCQKNGVEPPSTDEVLDRLGNKNLVQIIEEFIPDMKEEDLPSFMAECNSTCDGMLNIPEWNEDLYPGVRKTLITLKEQGHTLGIYTGTREDALEKLIDYHELDGLFDVHFIRSKDNQRDGWTDTGDLKQEQLKSLRDAFQRAGSPDQRIIVVCDSTADYKAAQNAGLEFYGFAPTDRKEETFKKAGATKTFRDFHNFLPSSGSAPRA